MEKLEIVYSLKALILQTLSEGGGGGVWPCPYVFGSIFVKSVGNHVETFLNLKGVTVWVLLLGLVHPSPLPPSLPPISLFKISAYSAPSLIQIAHKNDPPFISMKEKYSGNKAYKIINT